MNGDNTDRVKFALALGASLIAAAVLLVKACAGAEVALPASLESPAVIAEKVRALLLTPAMPARLNARDHPLPTAFKDGRLWWVDDNNVARYADRHADWRQHAPGQWYRWDGTRWVLWTATATMSKRADACFIRNGVWHCPGGR